MSSSSEDSWSAQRFVMIPRSGLHRPKRVTVLWIRGVTSSCEMYKCFRDAEKVVSFMT